MTQPLNGRLHRKRNHLQWKPSFAINSDKRHYWPQRVTTSRRQTEEKEHGGSLPHQPGPEKRNPGLGSRTDPWEGWTAVRTNASRSPQCQPEAGDPALRPKVKPTQRRESNVTIVDWGRTQTRPETGDLTWRPGTPQDQGIPKHCSPTRASRQVPDKEPG